MNRIRAALTALTVAATLLLAPQAQAMPTYCGYTIDTVVSYARTHGTVLSRMDCAIVTATDHRRVSRALGEWIRR